MPNPLKIALILLIILSFGVGLFIYHLGTTGGFKLPSSFTLSSSSHFSLVPGSQAPIGPSTPQGPQPTPGQTTIGAPGSPPPVPSITVSSSSIAATDIPAGFTVAQLSPYFHEVRFQGVSAGSFYNYGTIPLNTSFKNSGATGTIDITGWQIKSKNSGEYIPQAIALYDPSGLASPSDVRMANGDTAYLYSSSAPFNLRINKCVGYISSVANFRPALPSNCPSVSQSQIVNFTGACQNYIQSIGACRQPDMASPQIPRTDYACQDYLKNNFTYASCFRAHAGDSDFLSNQVWIWMGSTVIDQYHDVVGLFDRNGKLVDQYSY